MRERKAKDSQPVITIENLQQNYDVLMDNVKSACEQASRDYNDISVVAVTKTVPYEVVNQSFDMGVNIIGENRVQEFLSKYQRYNLDHPNGRINVHFIGKLQINKVKYIIDKVDMIESVDSVKLAIIIDRYADSVNRIIDILIEVNIGREETKSGVLVEDLDNVINAIRELEFVRIRGLMAIVPIEDGEIYLKKMQELFLDCKDRFDGSVDFKYLSMGMSNDYRLAIKYGANIIRIGTALYGKR